MMVKFAGVEKTVKPAQSRRGVRFSEKGRVLTGGFQVKAKDS